jgi:uncharacterized protein YjaG (DUF416 family)
MSSAKNVVEPFRDVVQDLLVPELRAVKVSVDSLRTEMKITNESMRHEMKTSNDALREEIKLRHEGLERTIREGDERNAILIRNLADKLDYAIDIRERLASIEARMPKQ